MEVNNTAPETTLGQEFELGADVIRQRALAATDDDRAQEQVASPTLMSRSEDSLSRLIADASKSRSSRVRALDRVCIVRE